MSVAIILAVALVIGAAVFVVGLVCLKRSVSSLTLVPYLSTLNAPRPLTVHDTAPHHTSNLIESSLLHV